MAREPFNPDLIPEPAKQRSDTGPSGPVTVTQLTAMVKRAIESVLPATVHVVGKISNFKRHSTRTERIFMKPIFLVILIIAVMLPGCDEESTIPKQVIGRRCTVQFDRNSLGSAHALPINPTTDGINGALVSLSGVIEQIDSSWIVMSGNMRKPQRDLLYIPMKSVLLIERHKEQ